MKNLLEDGIKCLIVQSKFSKFSFWNYKDVCKLVGAKYPAAPLGLITVAALLPQQWDFKIIDANVEFLLDEHFEWADIICCGGMLPQQQSTLSVINKAHRYGRPVVVGGSDPSSQPELYQSADYLVIGEGEVTIPMFLQDLERGCKSGEYQSVEKADMNEAVVPRYDLIKFKDYIQVGIQYSRGCPFNCEFCDIIELYGRKPRTKTSDQVIKELQALYNLGYRGHIDFVDDNFIGNRKSIKKVLSAVKEWSEAHDYPFYFSTESSINLADDDDLMQMMQDVDFRFVFIGIESPEDEILRLMNKKMNVNKSITNAINKIYSYGMIVNAGFIIGFDNETDKTAQNMIKCIQESGICMAMLGMLYALPNTQLTRRLEREGRLFEESSTLSATDTEIDQMTTGLNFMTTRPRLDVFKDYIQVIKYIYDPRHYFERVVHTCLNLKPVNKYKPSFWMMLKRLFVFFELCLKVGFDKKIGRLYWKTLVIVIFKNLRAVEAAVNLAAMYIHFYKMSKFIIDSTDEAIKKMEDSEREKDHKKLYFHQTNHIC
ncbi:B12-binding domain-containing radical SAM protein [bacterium]|nr:B12-binding domain-containing radical SAM protein [FCB group bacterium]MBL7191777.1 B12-binding domain-containing radical SAM protein [bacterium]